MLSEFLKWWGGQLAALIPMRFGDGGAQGDSLIVALPAPPTTGGFLLWRRQRAQETCLGRFSCDAAGMAALRRLLPQQPAQTRLRVPAVMLLEREVVLPAAAERNWRNALRYEMNRLTPFHADQVFWDGAVTRRDPARGKVTLRLSLIPKAALSNAMDLLAAAGLSPAAIEVPDQAGASRLIGLTETMAGTSAWRIPVWAMGGVCAALALIAIALPFGLQSYRAAAMARDIAKLRPAAAQAEALRRDRLAGTANASVVAAARAQVGDPLTVLAAVTGALPDNAFLTELTLSHLQLNIAGQAAAAAPLLSALSASPLLTNVTFSAPVTHDANKQQDLFAIQTNVAPQ